MKTFKEHIEETRLDEAFSLETALKKLKKARISEIDRMVGYKIVNNTIVLRTYPKKKFDQEKKYYEDRINKDLKKLKFIDKLFKIDIVTTEGENDFGDGKGTVVIYDITVTLTPKDSSQLFDSINLETVLRTLDKSSLISIQKGLSNIKEFNKIITSLIK